MKNIPAFKRVAQLKGSEGGFTLLELIVTLTIISFIVVLAFGAFRLGIKAWETGDERVDFLSRIKYLVDVMEKEISSSRPYYFRVNEEGEERTLAFRGEPNLISFISSVASHDPSVSGNGLREITFYFDRNKKHLIMKESFMSSHQPISGNNKKSRSVIISEDVSDLKFRYYILKGKIRTIRYDGVWVNHFLPDKEDSSTQILPRAVEVTMSIKAKKKKLNKSVEDFYLPSFIILLNAGMEFRFDNIESQKNDLQDEKIKE